MISRLIACVLFLWAVSASGRITYPEWPQIKIDGVDAANPASWRLFVTALKDIETPLSILDYRLEVFVAEGNEKINTSQEKPFLVFEGNVAAKGYKGKIKALAKTDVMQAVVFVVAAHAETAPEVLRAISSVIKTLFRSLRPDAKVSILVYGDILQVPWSEDGQRWEWVDLDDYQRCLGLLRAHGQRIKSEKGATCGSLVEGSETLAGVALPAGQGLFPRLFGIHESEEVLREAEKRGHFVLQRRRHVQEPFAGGAIEAAARMLMLGSDAFASRMIILLSDGRDGYLRAADLASEKIGRSRACTEMARACVAMSANSSGTTLLDREGGSRECTRQVLECTIPRVAMAMRRREEVVSQYLSGLISRLKAAGIRVHALAVPGTDDIGRARLSALALKSGGTYREAQDTATLEKVAAEGLAAELQAQVVVFPTKSLKPKTEYTAQVVLRAHEDVVSQPFRFRTGERVFFWEKPIAKGRSWVIAKTGHTLGPPLFWAGLTLAIVVSGFIALALGKGMVALARSMIKKKKPAGEKPLRVPVLKRPDKS